MRINQISWLGLIGLGLSVVALSPAAIAQTSPHTEQSPSVPARLEPIGEFGGSYDQLQSYLTIQDWQGADAETRRILQQWVHADGDLYGMPQSSAIPAEVIRQLDQLWSEASGGRFGFSAQQRLWQEIAAQQMGNPNEAVKAFGDRVGWTRTTGSDYGFIAPDWLVEPELTFSLQAPVGHLPWTGIDWQTVSDIASGHGSGCGSCTIDAMYLQGERFNRYLPGLYHQVKLALTVAAPISYSDWQTPQLHQEIDLTTLYPGTVCPVHTQAQAVSPDSQLLAVSSYSYERSCSLENNSTLTLWNLATGEMIARLVAGQATEAFAYTGTPQEPPTEPVNMVGDVANAIAFTPDARLVAAGLSDGTVKLWNAQTGAALRTLSGHQYAVHAIAISPDGRTLASASSDQTIRLWNLQTGQLLHSLSLEPSQAIPQRLQFSPDSRRLVSVTWANKVQLWNPATGQLIRTFMDAGSPVAQPMPVAFSPNGLILATSDVDNSVKLWNAVNGARMLTLRGHQAPVRSLAFLPDGQTLASNSEDNTVRLWNLQSPQLTRVFEAVNFVAQPQATSLSLGELAVSPDGRSLATSAILPPTGQEAPTAGLKLWDISSGEVVTAVPGVSSFSFTPDNQFLVTYGPTLRIWQPEQL
ncbi:MAG: hypothetical protein F6K04_05405 [Leptolyngbya sp. SIO4C5]|nr:hypothetical protein [Leptolyngbya sp. SIO4C5]